MEKKGSGFLSYLVVGALLAAVAYFVVLPRLGGDTVITVSPPVTNPVSNPMDNPVVPVTDTPLTTDNSVAVQAELARMQDSIVELMKALDECYEMDRLGKWGNVALPCQQIEGQVQFVMGQQRALLAAAAQANGQ